MQVFKQKDAIWAISLTDVQRLKNQSRTLKQSRGDDGRKQL
jgi:hypothetical protein